MSPGYSSASNSCRLARWRRANASTWACANAMSSRTRGGTARRRRARSRRRRRRNRRSSRRAARRTRARPPRRAPRCRAACARRSRAYRRRRSRASAWRRLTIGGHPSFLRSILQSIARNRNADCLRRRQAPESLARPPVSTAAERRRPSRAPDGPLAIDLRRWLYSPGRALASPRPPDSRPDALCERSRPSRCAMSRGDAGVSAATVSRALSTPEKVRAGHPCARARGGARARGYVLDGAARALRAAPHPHHRRRHPDARQRDLRQRDACAAESARPCAATRCCSPATSSTSPPRCIVARQLIERGVDGLVLVGLDHEAELFRIARRRRPAVPADVGARPLGPASLRGLRQPCGGDADRPTTSSTSATAISR